VITKLVEWVRSEIQQLATLRDRPHAIAGGIAIGVFFGFMPLFGVKTLLALGAAWLFRCNKIAAVVVVSLHDLLTPFAPIILRAEYQIGYWALSHPHHLPPKLGAGLVLHPAELLHWTTFFEIESPLLIGGLAIAIPLTAVAYGVSYWLASRRQARDVRSEK